MNIYSALKTLSPLSFSTLPGSQKKVYLVVITSNIYLNMDMTTSFTSSTSSTFNTQWISSHFISLLDTKSTPGEWVPKAPWRVGTKSTLCFTSSHPRYSGCRTKRKKTKGTFRVGALIKPTQIDARHRAKYAIRLNAGRLANFSLPSSLM